METMLFKSNFQASRGHIRSSRNRPRDEWSDNGVSSMNQNISIKSDIDTGDQDGWTDPSERFDKVDIGSVLTGFGIKE